jgi:hypothetical protein
MTALGRKATIGGQSLTGRVEVWRGGSRFGLSVAASFVWRCPSIRRLQPFRLRHSCSGCFRLEPLPGGVLTHWKAPPFHGARQERAFAPRLEPAKNGWRIGINISEI